MVDEQKLKELNCKGYVEPRTEHPETTSVPLKQVEALSFRILVDAPLAAAHSKFCCEGIINTGLEGHLKTCAECRQIIVKDLRDFARQIEGMRP